MNFQAISKGFCILQKPSAPKGGGSSQSFLGNFSFRKNFLAKRHLCLISSQNEVFAKLDGIKKGIERIPLVRILYHKGYSR